jgi:hypothetical protein
MRLLLAAALAALLSGCAPRQAGTHRELTPEALLRFHQHYNRFYRSYWGCPADARMLEDCVPVRGKVDLAELEAARATGVF